MSDISEYSASLVSDNLGLPQGSLRPGDVPRELAMLVDTSRERALAVAEQIRSSFLAATGEVDGKPVVATVSIGLVISYDAVLDLSALLAQADHALYRAKDNGRNRVEIASIELILDRVKRAAAAADRAASAKAAKSAA